MDQPQCSISWESGRGSWIPSTKNSSRLMAAGPTRDYKTSWSLFRNGYGIFAGYSSPTLPGES